jgi:hypothetical protein
MRLGFYNDFVPAVIADNGAVGIGSVVSGLNHGSPQLLMTDILTHFR